MSPTRPNILFILTDDQGAWALGCAGNREIHTPHLDRLASTGMRFDHFFCASPVCSPARASLLTGRIPSQHGVHDWIKRGNLPEAMCRALGDDNFGGDEVAIRYLEGLSGYTDFLAAAGYTCGLSGKWHLGDSLTPQMGFSYWRVVPFGGSGYFNAPMIIDGELRREPGYLTDAITAHALEFLDQQAGNPQPFYLSVHYTAPHSPWDAAQHPAELRELYRDCPFESIPDLPAHPHQINSAPRGTGERRRELLTGYYASLSGVDRGVGQLLERLQAHGRLADTLVIFASDNGMNMGHHGLWGKGNATFPQNMYDTSVKVPLIVSQPGRVPQGVTNADLLSQYDLLPTLLDHLGLENPLAARLPGRSFAPLLRGEALHGREHVVVFDEYGPVRMIRGRRWKYVHRYPYGPHELYDLDEDPGEERNRYGQAGFESVTAQLKGELDEWFARYADPRVDGAREGVTGKGQLGLAGVLGAGAPTYAGDWWYIDENGGRRAEV